MTTFPRAGKRRQRPEQALQISVAQFLAVALRPPTIWTAFPAGGGGKTRGAILKAMGLQAGWPDILVIDQASAALRRALVVGIELKSETGRMSVAQKKTRSSFVAAGAHWTMARTIDEVEAYLRSVGIPLHASSNPHQERGRA